MEENNKKNKMTVAEVYRMIKNLDLADAKKSEGALILATDGDMLGCEAVGSSDVISDMLYTTACRSKNFGRALLKSAAMYKLMNGGKEAAEILN
nr:MAG TPA: hypothetical protein [Bacteriophage sp.]